MDYFKLREKLEDIKKDELQDHNAYSATKNLILDAIKRNNMVRNFLPENQQVIKFINNCNDILNSQLIELDLFHKYPESMGPVTIKDMHEHFYNIVESIKTMCNMYEVEKICTNKQLKRRSYSKSDNILW